MLTFRHSRPPGGLALVLMATVLSAFLGLPAAALTEPTAPADFAPVQPSTSFGGAITSRSPSMLSVEANVFTLDAQTTWRFFNTATTDISLFDVGDLVLVRAVQVQGAWVAREVVMISNLVKDDGQDDSAAPAPNAALSGAITALSADRLTVEGITLLTDSKTVWKAGGETTNDLTRFDVGDQVVVEGSYKDGTWKAVSVELTVNAVPDEPPAEPSAPQPAAPQPAGPAEPVSVIGTIQTFMPESMMLDTGVFMLDEETVWVLADGSLGVPELFSVDDTVEVAAVRREDRWVARRVVMLLDINHT